MPRITTSLRLFFSAPPLKLKPFSSSLLRRPQNLHCSTVSSPVPKRPRIAHRRPLVRRSYASLAEAKGRGKEAAMEGAELAGFNRSRAEGRDGSDRPKKTLKLRERRSLNPSSSIAYVQILGTGMDTQDTLPSVLLFFDKQRFIFNAGEGLQRFCTEHKIKLSKIDHIFLSRVCSETTGGIPGLLLTLAGMGDEGMSVNLWGPSNLKHFINAMRSFIPNAAMVHARSFGPEPTSNAVPDPVTFAEPVILIEDEVVKISAFLLQTRCSNDMSVIYVCELSEVKGTFHPERAKALGLRPGPKYRELQLGNSVKSDSQDIMVHPSDVMDPSLPGPIVVLVDCPTESFMQELLSTPSLNPYYVDFSGNPVEGAKSVTCIVHLSPTSIVSSPDYQKWMMRFGSAQHIMAGHEMKNVEVPVLNSSARIATRLNYLCPQLFPFPGYWSLQDLNYSVSESTTSSEAPVSKLCKSISAENLLKFTLRPYAQLGLDRSCIPSLKTPSEITDELLSEIPEIADAAQHVDRFWHEPRKRKEETKSVEDNGAVMEEPLLGETIVPSCLEDIRRDDMEIVLLGTGSSEPSKYRNVSSIYINLFAKGGIFLDCGEGALGQLKRRYGLKGADDAVKKLNCIWISHIHADHHAGITRILALRRDLLKGVPHEPLLVVGPGQLKRFLHGYQELEDLDMQFLDCRNTTIASLHALEGSNKDNDTLDSTLFARGAPMQSYWNRPVDIGTMLKSLKNVLGEAGIEALVSFPVVHCPQAYGVVLEASERTNSFGKVIPGWKLVYSGDTRPCPALVEAARDATVLIHEATFEDAMMHEAVARNHSTTKEAIEVGASAGVYRIVLTHFSQRYPKIPVIEDEDHMHKTCIAFDMMSINVADLPVIPRILPYIKLLFRNEMIVEDSDDVDVADVAS